MEIKYSKTGSDGNVTIISDGLSELIIDAGIRPKSVKSSGADLSNIRSGLITHAHMDHVQYLKAYTERGIKFYCSEETKIELGFKGIYDSYYCQPIKSTSNPIVIETFKIKPFVLPHTNPDGTDCHNFGYLIYSKVDDKRLLYITDCHYIPQQFPPCEYYILECNYSEIENFEEEMPFIEPCVESRRFKSHMSMQSLKLFLAKQDFSRCEWIKLIHISKSSTVNGEEMRKNIEQYIKEISGREIEVNI